MTARYQLALKRRRRLAKPYLPDLIMAISFSLVAKPDRLTRAEMRFLFLAHVADDDGVAEELRLEAEKLMRPSHRDRRAPRAGPWLVAA